MNFTQFFLLLIPIFVLAAYVALGLMGAAYNNEVSLKRDVIISRLKECEASLADLSGLFLGEQSKGFSEAFESLLKEGRIKEKEAGTRIYIYNGEKPLWNN